LSHREIGRAALAGGRATDRVSNVGPQNQPRPPTAPTS
jgi:hypothetical protein